MIAALFGSAGKFVVFEMFVFHGLSAGKIGQLVPPSPGITGPPSAPVFPPSPIVLPSPPFPPSAVAPPSWPEPPAAPFESSLPQARGENARTATTRAILGAIAKAYHRDHA